MSESNDQQVEPVDFYSIATGEKYTARSAEEITRLSYSRSHTRTYADAEVASFDPGQNTVAQVIEYLSKNPEQAARVIEMERAGQNRKTITGDE
jgi:hypothetical protein